METKYKIDDILNAIVDEKPVDLQAAVNSLMVDKAHDQIADLKSVIMQDMLRSEDDPSDDEDDEEEEFEDDEDDVDELDAEELFTDDDDNEEQ